MKEGRSEDEEQRLWDFEEQNGISGLRVSIDTVKKKGFIRLRSSRASHVMVNRFNKRSMP